MTKADNQLVTGRAVTPEHLLALKAQQAQALFNELPLEEKIGMVLSASWAQRQKLIVLAVNSEELVQALPEEEIYWTVKEIGPEDALPIISRLSFDQLQYIIDVDCWNKDLIDMAAVTRWLRMMLRCREENVLEWVTRTDDGFLNFAFKKLFTVFRLSDDIDLAEASDLLPTWTIDGMYYFKFTDDEARLVSIPFLHLLYKTDSAYFYYLMENTRCVSAIELEEDVLRIRQGRMAEQGFPEQDEAWSIYQYLSADEIQALLDRKHKDARAAAESLSSLPRLRYRFTLRKPPLFVHAVLQNMTDMQSAEKVQREIISLTNRVMIADCEAVRETADKEKAFNKVLGYINISLELLGNRDTETAVRLMEEVPAHFLFRAGYSRALDLKKNAKLFYAELRRKKALLPADFFAAPWDETIAGLLMIRPLFFAGAIDSTSSSFREFETADDIQAAENVLEIAKAITLVLFDCFGLKEATAFTGSATEPAEDRDQPRAQQLFMTVLARHILYGTTELAPLTATELATFLGTVFSAGQKNAAGAAALNSNLLPDTLSWLCRQYRITESTLQPLRTFVQHCFDVLEEECGALAGLPEIDTRYVNVFLFRN